MGTMYIHPHKHTHAHTETNKEGESERELTRDFPVTLSLTNRTAVTPPQSLKKDFRSSSLVCIIETNKVYLITLTSLTE